jgi:hypothetical protein
MEIGFSIGVVSLTPSTNSGADAVSSRLDILLLVSWLRRICLVNCSTCSAAIHWVACSIANPSVANKPPPLLAVVRSTSAVPRYPSTGLIDNPDKNQTGIDIIARGALG